jgi:hypothetical protein
MTLVCKLRVRARQAPLGGLLATGSSLGLRGGRRQRGGLQWLPRGCCCQAAPEYLRGRRHHTGSRVSFGRLSLKLHE